MLPRTPCCDGRHVVQRDYGGSARPRWYRRRRFHFPNQVSQHGSGYPRGARQRRWQKCCGPAYLRRADGVRGSLGRAAVIAQCKIAEADPRIPTSTPGSPKTVLAGGAPNWLRNAARFMYSLGEHSTSSGANIRPLRGPLHGPLRDRYVTAASAIDSASRAPSSSPRQQNSNH